MIIICPIFLSIYGCYVYQDNKVYFLINIFGKIKIIGGYLQILSDGVFVHYSNRKAFLIDRKKLLGLKKKFKPLKDYHILFWSSNLELGNKSLLEIYVLAHSLNYLYETTRWVLRERKPYIKIENSIDLYENKEFINIYLKSKAVLNILMLLISVIKILVEKVIYVAKNRKQ